MKLLSLPSLVLALHAVAGYADAQTNWGDLIHQHPSSSVHDGVQNEMRARATWARSGVSPDQELAVGMHVEWEPVEVVQNEWGYRHLLFQGRVLWRPDEEDARPVDWLQGMCLLVGRNPGDRLDWSRGRTTDDTAGIALVLTEDGSFRGGISCNSIRRVVGGSGEYQIGLVPAQAEGDRLTYRDRDAALPDSVAIAVILGPPPIDESLQKINAVAGVDVRKVAPDCLIRAVNHLHALGKEEALDALERFLALATPFQWSSRNPASSDDADSLAIYWIVRTLFEPEDPATGYQWIDFAMVNKPGAECQRPQYPIVVIDDVPLLVVDGVVHTGPGPYAEHQIAWAREKGRLRERPLTPSTDPVAAAEKLLAALREENPEMFLSYRSDIRRQVQQALGHLIDPDVPRGKYQCSEAWWVVASKLSQAGQIQWDPTSERFTRSD